MHQFFEKREREQAAEEAQYENPLFVDHEVAEGIRAALQRTDLTAQDRAEFEAALEKLEGGEPQP